nr:hypothetical protein HUO10_003335 [Paraburkholderia busanensis]
MTQDDSQMKLRLPASVKEALTKSAKVNGRSLNQEAVIRLENSFWSPGQATQSGEPLSSFLKEVPLEKLMTELIGRFPPGLVQIRMGNSGFEEDSDEPDTPTERG